MIEVVEMGGPDGPFALIRSDPPTDEEWRMIGERGLRVHVVGLAPGLGLEVFLPHVDKFDQFSIIAGEQADISPIGDMTQLRKLTITGPVRMPIDISRMDNLVSYGGSLRAAPGVLSKSSIRRLSVPFTEDLLRIGAPIKVLRITSARHMRRLPEFSAPHELIQLTIADAKELSLRGLSDLPSLEELWFDACGLDHADEIARLANLRSLRLEDCRRVEPASSLAKIVGANVRVVGKHVFSREFRSEVTTSGKAAWSFPSAESAYVQSVGNSRRLPTNRSPQA